MGFRHLKCHVGKALELPPELMIFKHPSVAFETVGKTRKILDETRDSRFGEQTDTEGSWCGGDDGALG